MSLIINGGEGQPGQPLRVFHITHISYSSVFIADSYHLFVQPVCTLKAPTDSQHCFKAKHAFHCAFACFEWLSTPLYLALRHVVFRFVFLASVSATRNKTRKHEM
jgi:hypothetical protein